MPAPLLATKLYVPRPRAGIVPRARLLARLTEGLHRVATLVSAPAGFGKTTLVAAWVATLDRPVAWLSLDADDRDPARLRAYLVAALDRHADGVDPGLREAARAILSDELLAALVHEVAAAEGSLVVVLDDAHLLDEPAAEAVLGYLLDHPSPDAHLVLLSRQDPALPLARLRARDELGELRVADLRFHADEAAAFLRAATGKPLADAEVAALDARTEGWAAALQLAAVSLRGQDDVARFVAGFTGSQRFVADYLIEEVLQQQPGPVQEFLLRTSVLERLSGPLCDAVTEGAPGEGARTLAALERADLLLVPLDDERTWYRYHHLFADVLRLRAGERHPGEAPALHARASAWYEAYGSPHEAIHHALEAGATERAATLVEALWSDAHAEYRYETVEGWLRALPEALVHRRPGLAAGAGWSALMLGRLEAVEPRFAAAERALDGPDGLTYDDAGRASLEATIAAGRAYAAQARGDVDATRAHAQRVLDLGDEAAGRWRGVAATLLGIAAWTRGDLATAERVVAETLDWWLAADVPSEAVSVTYVLASVLTAQGRWRAAMAAYERAIRMAEQVGPRPPIDAADVHRGYADLLRKRGAYDEAVHHLGRAQAIAERGSVPDWRHRFEASVALLALARGDHAAALDHIGAALREVVPTALPSLQPVRTLEARIHVARGDAAAALAWAHASGLTLDAPLEFQRAHEQVTYARALTAAHAVGGDADGLAAVAAALERWRAQAHAAGFGEVELDATVALALTLDARGDRASALDVLDQALAVGELEGQVGAFLDEGPAMLRLLEGAAASGLRPAFVARLRTLAERPPAPAAAFGGPIGGPIGAEARSERTSTSSPPYEPLTDREADVLRLIAEGRSNQEIADRLELALSTVKGYNRNLFGKLMVERRTEAVARARALGLID